MNYRGLIAAIFSAALLAGCGGSQPPIGAPGAAPLSKLVSREVAKPPLGPTYKASGPLLFVANYDLTLTPLAIYNADANNPEPIATISKDIDNSLGACIDGDGTLYVTNDPGSGPGWISEYALGQTKPSRVITKGINTPAFCAIDASGNLWVANSGLDNVVEYLKGSTKPHTTITSGLTYPEGIAIDHAGNLYVGNLHPYGTSNIQVYAPGSKSPSRTITDGIAWPDGIAVDAHGTLYVADYSSSTIEEYRFGQSKPSRAITDGLSLPACVVVDKKGWLYVANSGKYSDQTAILEFPPHSLKPSSREITKGLFHPVGLAYYPPLLP